MTDRIVVGKLSGAYGVKGEVRVKSFCADPVDIAEYTPLYLENGQAFEQLVLTGVMKGALTARLNGVVSKEDADRLNGQSLYADRLILPSLEDDEYYYADLIGLDVFDAGGTLLGTVKNVADHGAGDLVEVALKGAGETVFVPFTKENVPTVDLASGKIITDPPEGLF